MRYSGYIGSPDGAVVLSGRWRAQHAELLELASSKALVLVSVKGLASSTSESACGYWNMSVAVFVFASSARGCMVGFDIEDCQQMV